MSSEQSQSRDEFLQALGQKPTDELIQLALTASDEEDNWGWDAISELRNRGTREVFDAARTLCESVDPLERSTGITILAQLGLKPRPFLDETLELFFKLMASEQDHRVLNALGVGLGHISPDPRKVDPLLQFKNHVHPEVRLGVAFGLSGEDDPSAIQALIELSADEDDEVRDWATFALGSQTALDTPEIREALYKRAADLDDPSNASGEGLVGLANRHDERAFEFVSKHLQAGYTGTLVIEAAENLADPRLYPLLVKLADDLTYIGYEKQALEDAIAACQPRN
ncbi:MAG: HEAT repeat domain-containing protein [Chloroflexi bacterium]|nr:HEAT repeat domain-containing protein [Chloroflexota bacterium]MCC6897280.1 HEAT repeat domain-containing protein [Anaerolineae bacterium]